MSLQFVFQKKISLYTEYLNEVHFKFWTLSSPLSLSKLWIQKLIVAINI